METSLVKTARGVKEIEEVRKKAKEGKKKLRANKRAVNKMLSIANEQKQTLGGPFFLLLRCNAEDYQTDQEKWVPTVNYPAFWYHPAAIKKMIQVAVESMSEELEYPNVFKAVLCAPLKTVLTTDELIFLEDQENTVLTLCAEELIDPKLRSVANNMDSLAKLQWGGKAVKKDPDPVLLMCQSSSVNNLDEGITIVRLDKGKEVAA